MTDIQLHDIDLPARLLLDELNPLSLEAREQHFVLGAQDPRHGAVEVRGMLDLVRGGPRRLWPHLRHPLEPLVERQVRVDERCRLCRDLAQEITFLLVGWLVC